MDLLDLHTTSKILFAVDLKHSSCSQSADIIPMSNDVVHAMPWPSFSVYTDIYWTHYLCDYN